MKPLMMDPKSETKKPSYCFDEKEFQVENFDPALFLSKAQLSHPLELLQNDLHSYLARLKKELYDLINRDYADLVAVSSKLVGVEDKAALLSDQLLEAFRQVQCLQANANAAATSLEAKVAQRQAVRTKRQALQRSLRFARLVAATEHMLGLRTTLVDDPEDDEEEKGRSKARSNHNHTVGDFDGDVPSDIDDDNDADETDGDISNAFKDFTLHDQSTSTERHFVQEPNPSKAVASKNLFEQCALLERAAHNVVMLITERGGPVHSATRAAPGTLTPPSAPTKEELPPVIQSMALRAQRCEVEVARQLEAALSSLLSGCRQAVADESYTHQVDGEALLHCLRSFCLLGQGPRAEGLIASQMMKPFLDITFTQGQLDGKVRGSCSGLPAIYGQTLAFIQRASGQLLQATEELLVKMTVNETGADLDFVCNGIWRPMSEAIQTKLGAIFAAGLADSFHTNYTLSIQFLEDLSGICGEAHRGSIRKRLQHSAPVKEFLSKWNLPIYFQLRFGEITSQIDQVYEASEKEGLQTTAISEPNGKSSNEKCFDLTVLQQTWASLQRCWSEAVFLKPLAHKFLRLTAQILRRYEVWVTGQAWKRTPEDLVLVSFGTSKFYSMLKGEFTEKLVTLLSTTEGSGDAVRRYLEEACEPDEALVEKLWGEVVVYITGQCTTMLQAVRGITATYRMTNKPAPKSPSPFVRNILQPLKDFLSTWSEKIPELANKDWKSNVLNSVTCKYKDNVLELLTTVKQMEETLKRRSKSKQKTADKGLTDTDKMLLQLLFDVNEFGVELKNMGLQIDTCEAYQELLNEVKPAERFL